MDSLNSFVPHGLKPGFVKLCVDDDIENIHINITGDSGVILRVPLSQEQKVVMSKAISIVRKDESSNDNLKSHLIEKMDNYSNIKTIKEWWNKLPVYFSITPAGEALANAYAQGKDPSVPSLY